MQPGEMIWFLVGIGTGLALAMLGFALMAVVDSRRLVRESAPAQPARDSKARRVTLPSLDDPIPDVPPEPVPAQRRHAGAAQLKRREEPEGSLDEMMSSLAAELERMQTSETTQVTVELPNTVSAMTAVAEPMNATAVPPLSNDQPAVVVAQEAPPRADAPLTPMRAAMTRAMESRRALPRDVPAVDLPAAPSAAEAPRLTETARGPIVEPGALIEARVAARAPRPGIAPPASFTPAIGPSTPSEPTFAAVDGQDTPEPEPEVIPTKPKIPPLPRVAPARKFAPALPPRHPPAGSKAN